MLQFVNVNMRITKSVFMGLTGTPYTLVFNNSVVEIDGTNFESNSGECACGLLCFVYCADSWCFCISIVLIIQEGASWLPAVRGCCGAEYRCGNTQVLWSLQLLTY